MAIYQPPTENLPIFDPSVFPDTVDDETYAKLKNKFVRYPTAQGLVSFPFGLTSSGLNTFNMTGLSNQTIFNNTSLNSTIVCNIPFNGSAISIIGPANTTSPNGLQMTNAAIRQLGSAMTDSSNINTYNQFNSCVLRSGCLLRLSNQTTTAYSPLQFSMSNTGSGNFNLWTRNSNTFYLDYINTSNTQLNVFSISSTASGLSSPLTFTPLMVCNATMPAVTDNSTTIPTTGWVQGAISAGGGGGGATNITPNSIVITPSPKSSTTGITNIYNATAKACFSGTGGNTNTSLGSTFVANNGIQFDFNTGGATTPSSCIIVKFSIVFTFWNSSSFGETSCFVDFYPNRWTQGSITPNANYNINNKINGNQNYQMTDATYAPNGRQYWTYNQSFSGITGAQALFQPHNGYWNLFFCIPDNSYSYSCEVRAMDTSNAQANSYCVQLDVI